MSMGMTASPPVTPREVKSWKLPAMMTVAGGLAGLLIVSVYELTLPRIEHHKAEVLKAAVQEVLRGPSSFDTLYLRNDALVKSLPAGTDAKGVERIYLGRDAAGKPIGFAVSATENGFQDPMTVMFGYDHATKTLIAMRVIANKETPGLGDKIEKDTSFVNDFDHAALPLTGVKKGTVAKDDEIVMITGATISSRAVMRIINNAIARWQPLMDAYVRESHQ